MSTAALPVNDLTAQDLADRVGPIPLWRIRHDPPPGTATEEDVERIRREESHICELIDGVLVEKVSTDEASVLTVELATLLGNVVSPRRLGWIAGPNGYFWLSRTKLLAPDLSFVRRDQRPGGRLLKRGYSDRAPALAVEVFSPGNTAGEMQQKREEFFEAGTELFWIVYPDRQEVEVWSDPTNHQTLRNEDVLDGGSVLPGFTVPVAEIFASLDLGPLGDQGSPSP